MLEDIITLSMIITALIAISVVVYLLYWLFIDDDGPDLFPLLCVLVLGFLVGYGIYNWIKWWLK